LTAFIFSDWNYKIVMFLSQTESTPKHFFRKKALGKGKGKAIPLQALTSLEGSRRLRLPDFKIIGSLKWQGCQNYAPAAFTPPGYIPGNYSFLLEDESTPGP
jgi:hypothetical protein